MFKVTFDIPYRETVAGNTSDGLCIPLPEGIMPKPGETWIVEAVRRISARTYYVRLIRPWRGLLADYECIQKGNPDFNKGVLCFNDGTSFPLSRTAYARAWEDYQILSSNTNAVIIRDGMAVRWRKKGKPPEEMPLHRFATKYKRQQLLGKQEDIENFLNSLELLVAKAVEESRKKKEKNRKGWPAAEGCNASSSSLHLLD
ncbi:MAG: hypothetical protein HPY89_01650 [Pelotomaculum sp.]|uniref:Uncharacterized protein n=1 Tax=Pelotomaculum thermopropionicum (strain DSM 13744 / JCM 10971 / SI) TaxID=370438 RepID=A5D0I9_PELTS|nr:hypothetical protein [Pelotomaculum sp.]BAF60229.1 hypothetical protein PTH_2048 [Pelotomaculum thermopropionicum SI]